MPSRRALRQSLCSALVVGLVAVSFSACSDELPDPWLVTTPRIAAIRAEPPSARVGQAVTLDTLVVRPSATTEPTPHFWACALAAGADPRTCLPPGTIAHEPSGATTVIVPDAASAELVVFAAVCSVGEPSFGARLDTVRCGDGTQASIAYKRVAVVGDEEPPSANPTVSSITIELSGGCSSSARCARRIAVRVDAAGDAERQLVTDFLTTAGEIDPFRIAGVEPETRWEPPRDPPVTPVDFWAVTRDGEGGVGWQIASLAAE